jgi:Transposase IS4
MIRPRRDTQLPSRFRSSSPPKPQKTNRPAKRRRIGTENVDRNDVDQALAVIAAAPEGVDAPPTLISTELPQFEPDSVENRDGCSQHTNLSESGFFRLFFSDLVVEIISQATNSYAEFQLHNPPLSLRKTCPWKPTTPAEIRVYIGLHLHFGLYKLSVRSDYWKLHKITQFMGYARFKQIHRFFSFNDESTASASSNAPWFHRIQRVSELIRTGCQNAYIPSSHIAIDEAMIAFKERFKHIVKLKNKPINTGYKVWCISDYGYIWSWLFHSKIEGVKTLKSGLKTQWPCADNLQLKSAELAPTFAFVLRLADLLPKKLQYYIYLDNLFLNLPVAQCLLAMNIRCMGTTRKKATGFPPRLQGYVDDNHKLLWNSTIAEVVDNNTLCFIWQDNKTVAAISTAHSLHRTEDRIQRKRRCPKINSENQRILLPVFQGESFKDLFIPKAIDDYNHHMKGVDQADQLRASFTCHRKQNYRNWTPFFYFEVDISCSNAYLLWKWSSPVNSANAGKTHTSHRVFMETLCSQLLHSNDPIEEQEEEQQGEQKEAESQSLPTAVLSRHHVHIQKELRGRCQWGKLHPPGCPRKRSSKRKFGTDITETVNNSAGKAILGGSMTRYGCSKCHTWLCIEGSCWQQYHHTIGVNL